MTHYCSNYSIERIVSITLVNALDWTQCAAWTVFLSVWEQIYSFPWGGSLWCVILVVLFVWNCSVSDPNFLFAWCIGHCDCIFWVLQNTMSYHQQWNLYLTYLWCVVWIRVYFEWYHLLYLLHLFTGCNMSLHLFILPLLHQYFQYTYHENIKWVNLCLKNHWWYHVAACFVCQVCVDGQFCQLWLMSNNILLKHSKLWGLQTYV